MAYEENMPRMEGAHHVILEGREQLSVSGVEEVSGHIRNVIICIICSMIWLYMDMIKKHGNIMWRTALWMENIKER